MASKPFLTPQHRKGDQLQVGVSGDWIIEHAGALRERLAHLPEEIAGVRKVVFQCSGLGEIDASGAWILYQAVRHLESQGFQAELAGFKEAHSRFIQKLMADGPPATKDSHRKRSLILDRIEKLGEGCLYGVRHLGEAAFFLVLLSETLIRNLVMPWRFRFSNLVANMYRTGVTAIPIVGLMAFLISIVLAYQGATQLARFGAEIFTINLTAVSLLREMGVMLTAILVAGRSGSAFAAEIGTMKLNEELDAMQTMGLDPFEVLILPRVIAMVIMLPMLTLLANLVGLAGGGLSVYLLLDMPLQSYLTQVRSAIIPWTFWVGFLKAPVFAFLIATAGTFWGLQGVGSAESVGRSTTVAVVQSIFMVIAADAVFSILFTWLGI